MRVIGRLLAVLAVAFPVVVAFVGVAGAGGVPGATGPAVLNCMHWEDRMNISPGVSNVPKSQTVVARGKLYGCNKAGGGARYSSTMSMANATCANLAMSGTATFDWVNGNHSTGFLYFQPQATEPNKVHITGYMTSGLFQGLVVNAWVRFTQVYNGTGANCSPTNTLRRIDFTNSQSFQLLTPTVTTTTQPPGTTTPSTPPSTPRPTVPVTNFGSTTAPATFGPPFTGFGGPPPGNGFPPQQFPQGTLAFTGSSSGLAAMFGLEALLVGGALACLDPERRRRRLARFAYLQHRPKSYLSVTLPPMR